MLKIKSTVSVYYLILLLSLPVFAQYKVVGYYAEWFKAILPANKVKFEGLTDINHAFVSLDENGHFSYSAEFVYPQLNKMAHDNNVKIFISVGGWGNAENFSVMAVDSLKRVQFIDDLTSFIQNNAYDGVDFDWEYPSNISERTALNNLVKETRVKFDSLNPQWIITMAVPTGNWYGQWQDYNNLKTYVTWFNAMCYDFHGSWSGHSGHNAPLYQPAGDFDGSVETALQYLHNTRGIPKDQLTVGIPFYGKQFNSATLYSDFSNPVTDLYFSEIVPLVNIGWNYFWDDIAKVPFLINDGGDKLITFDDTVSVRIKCDWIKNQGFSGAMIWALGEDMMGDKQPLAETIGDKLLPENVSEIAERPNPASDLAIFQNYPNPFNNSTMINYQLSATTIVELSIYNIIGQKVTMLINKKQTAGCYSVQWDAGSLASGVYLYKIQAGSVCEIKKMILLK